MGDLRDQLKKAKLLSQKEAKRLAHEERIHRKNIGREGLEREQSARAEEIEALRAQDRERSRATQQEVEDARRAAAERAACQDILRNDVVRPHGRGSGRWYFQLEDGSLPWFDADEPLRFQLQSGAFWVVRVGPDDSHVYGLLAAELGKRVYAILPRVVVWMPGGAPG